MTVAIINPGSGPVTRANEDQAVANMEALISDIGAKGVEVKRCKAEDGDGRYGFVVSRRTKGGKVREVVVTMPGLKKARYFGKLPRELPPRLFVDGNSWWWPYAVSVVAEHLKVKYERYCSCGKVVFGNKEKGDHRAMHERIGDGHHLVTENDWRQIINTVKK